MGGGSEWGGGVSEWVGRRVRRYFMRVDGPVVLKENLRERSDNMV